MPRWQSGRVGVDGHVAKAERARITNQHPKDAATTRPFAERDQVPQPVDFESFSVSRLKA
jgi:hypothetical protein